jgi:hypothetical protein
MTFALKELTNSTKYLNRNENYIKTLEVPFIFNLQTMSTARHHCRSFERRPNVVGCEWEIAKRAHTAISVSEMKKKDEPLEEVHDDHNIPTSFSTLLSRWG